MNPVGVSQKMSKWPWILGKINPAEFREWTGIDSKRHFGVAKRCNPFGLELSDNVWQSGTYMNERSTRRGPKTWRLSARLPEELQARAEEVARMENRTVAQIIEFCLEGHLPVLEKQHRIKRPAQK